MAETSGAAEHLIVALDCDRAEAIRLADALSGTVRWVKVGMTLFYREGPSIVAVLRERGFEVFVDLKLHDIPHQVEGAAESLGRLGVQMLTVHASGGADMVRAAVRGARAGAQSAGVARPTVLAVTVLTSMDDENLRSVGVLTAPSEQVLALSGLAVDAGADGIVCSPLEAEAVRARVGESVAIVTPGVRPVGADSGDQARIMTPGKALSAGATHLVIGRPITAAPDPVAAARSILDEMEAASHG
jgi:orotidine-5'-phosphate decarboxylase